MCNTRHSSDRSASSASAIVTNLTELWWDDEMQSLLDLYAVTIGQGRAVFSDYEKFRALCEMMPLMNGHPKKAFCGLVLRELFQINLSMTLETCDMIWKQTAQTLLLQAPIGLPCITVDVEEEAVNIAVLQRTGAAISMPPKLLLPSVCMLSEWQGAILQWLDGLDEKEIFLPLQDEFCFSPPDPYHVGAVLQSECRTPTEQSLLTAQLLRILCIEAQVRELTLHLHIGMNRADAVKLLGYLEKTVGLPALIWSTDDDNTRDALLDFSLQKHQCCITPAVCISNLKNEATLQREIITYARRYPVGLLCLTDK